MEASFNSLWKFRHSTEYGKIITVSKTTLFNVVGRYTSTENFTVLIDIRKPLPRVVFHSFSLFCFVILISQRFHFRRKILICPGLTFFDNTLDKCDSILNSIVYIFYTSGLLRKFRPHSSYIFDLDRGLRHNRSVIRNVNDLFFRLIFILLFLKLSVDSNIWGELVCRSRLTRFFL